MSASAEHRTLLSSVSPGSDVTAWCQGSFFAFGSDDACLIYNDILIVAPTSKVGDPQARLEQPLGSPANDACTLKCPLGIGAADALVTCHRCGTLAVLRYSQRAARFIAVQRITVSSAPGATGRAQPAPRPDDPTTLVGTTAASDPRGRAIALAAPRHRVAVFFAAAYATPNEPDAFEEALKVWQADPATQATQSTARETPAPRKDEDDDDEATTSAIVLQALLGEGSTFGTPAERGAEDSAMHDVSGDGGGAVEAATPALMHSEDTPMMDSGAADSLARLSLSGSGGTAGMALRGAGAAPSAGALRRQRQGLFLLQEPVTWNALQHSWADASFSSDVEPRSHPALAKKQAIMRAAGFTDISPHVDDPDQADTTGAAPRPFRVADIEDVTFLDFPDPRSMQPSQRGGPPGSRGGSMHGSLRGGGSSGVLRGSGSSAAALGSGIPEVSPRDAGTAEAGVGGSVASGGSAGGGLAAAVASQPPAATGAVEEPSWGRIHLVMLTGGVTCSSDADRIAGANIADDSAAPAVQQECALLCFDLRSRAVEELRRCDVNSADMSSSRGPFNVGAAHTVLPVPGAPSSVALLTPRFALLRDFCTADWTAGEVGCWTCAVSPTAPMWTAPGIVPISAAAPQSKKLRRVPSMVPSHMLPAGAFDMSDGFSTDSDSGNSDIAPAGALHSDPDGAARHRFRRDAAPPPSAPPPAAGRVTAAAWLRGDTELAAVGSTRGGALGGGTLMGLSGSRANLLAGLDRGSLEHGSLERGLGMDDVGSADSMRAQRRKRTYTSAMQSDRPPRQALSRVPGTSIIKATLAAKIPRSSSAPVTAIQLFVSACTQEPCSLVAVTACIAARPSVRPADGHVSGRASGRNAAAAAAEAAAARVAAALGGEAGVQCVRNVFAVDALAAPFKPGLAAGAAPERQRPGHGGARMAGLDEAPPMDDARSALDVIASIAAESADPTQPCATRLPAPVPWPICLISSTSGFVMTASASGSILAYRPSMVARPQSLSSRVRSADKAAMHVHHYRLLQEYPTTPHAVAIGTLMRPSEAAQSTPPQSFRLPIAALAAASGQLLTLSQAAELVPSTALRLPSVVHDLHACGGGGNTVIVSSAMHAATVQLPPRRPSVDHDHAAEASPARFSEVAGGACAAAASVPDVGLRSASSQLFLYSDRLDVYVPGRHPIDEVPLTQTAGFAGQCGTAWRCEAGEALVASAAACGGIAAAVIVGEGSTMATLAVWSVAVEEGPSADAGLRRGAQSSRGPLAPGTQLAQQEVLMSCQGSDQPDRSMVRAAMTCMAVEGSASCVALCPSPSPLTVPSASAASSFSHSEVTTTSQQLPVGTALQWLCAIISWDASATISCISVDAPGRRPAVHVLQTFDLAAAVTLHFPALTDVPRPNSAALWAPPQPPSNPATATPDLSALNIIAVLAVGMRGGQLSVVSLRGAAPAGAPEDSAFHRPMMHGRRVAGFARIDSMRTIQGMLTAGQIVPECSAALGVLPVALQPLNSDPFLHGGTIARRVLPRTVPSVASLDRLNAHGGDTVAGCGSCGNADAAAAIMPALHCLAACDTMHTLNLEVAPGGSLGVSICPIATSEAADGAAAACAAVLSSTTSHTKTGRCTVEYGLAVARNLPDASAQITLHTLAWPHCAAIAADAPQGLHPATLPRMHAFLRIVECTPKPAAAPAAAASRAGLRAGAAREESPQRFTHLTHVRVYSQTHALAFSEPPDDPHAIGRITSDHHPRSSELHALTFPAPAPGAGDAELPRTAVAAQTLWSAPRGHTLSTLTAWAPFPTHDPAAYAAACVSHHTSTAASVRAAAHRGLLAPLFLVVGTSNRYLGSANHLLSMPELVHSFGAYSAVSKLHILALHMQHTAGVAHEPVPFAPAAAAAARRDAHGARADGRAELYPPFDPDALEIRAAHTVAVHTIRNGALCALCAHQSHLFAACGTAIWTYRFPTRVPSLLRGDSPKAANMALAELPEPSSVKVLQPVLSMSVDVAAQLLIVVDCLHGVQLFSLPQKKANGRSMEPIQCIAGSAVMRSLSSAFPWPPPPAPPQAPHLHAALRPCTSYMFRCEPPDDGSPLLLPWDVRIVAAMATGVLRPRLSPYQAAWLRGLAGTSPCGGTSDSPTATAQQRLERVVVTASRPSRAVSAACRQAEVIAAAVAACCSCGPPPADPIPLEAALQVLLLAELRTGADAAVAAAAAAGATPLPPTRPVDVGVLEHTLTSSIPRLAEALNDEFIPSWPPAVTLNTVAADEAEDLMLALFALYSSCVPQDAAAAAAAYPKQTYLGVELAPTAGATPAAAAAGADAVAAAFRAAVHVPERPVVCALVDALDRVRRKWSERPRSATPCSLAFMFLMHVTLNHYVAGADSRPTAPLFASSAQHEAQQLRHISRIVHDAEEALTAFLDYEDATAGGTGGFDGAVPELMHGTQGWLRGHGYPADDSGGMHLSGDTPRCITADPTGQAWVRKVMEDVPGSEHIEAFLVWWYIVCTGGGWPVDAAGDMHAGEGYKADGSGYPDAHPFAGSTESLSTAGHGGAEVKQSGEVFALGQQGAVVRLRWDRAEWVGEDPPSALAETVDACMPEAVDAAAMCCTPARTGGVLASMGGGAVAQIVPLSAAARADVAGGSIVALDAMLRRLQRALLQDPATAPPGAWQAGGCGGAGGSALWAGLLRQFATAPLHLQLQLTAAVLRDARAAPAAAHTGAVPSGGAVEAQEGAGGALRGSSGMLGALSAALPAAPGAAAAAAQQEMLRQVLRARSVLLCAVQAVL